MKSYQLSNLLTVKDAKQKKIDRANRRISSIGPIQKKFHTIRFLYLSHNHIQNLEGVQSFKQLYSVSLSFNRIDEFTELLKFVNRPQIKYLNIAFNPLTKNPNYRKMAMIHFKNLKKLDDLKLNDRPKIRDIENNFFKMGQIVLAFLLILDNDYSMIKILKSKIEQLSNISSSSTLKDKQSKASFSFLIDQIFNSTNEDEGYSESIYHPKRDPTFLISAFESLNIILDSTRINDLDLASEFDDLKHISNKCSYLIDFANFYSREFKNINFLDPSLFNTKFYECFNNILLSYSYKNDCSLINYLKTSLAKGLEVDDRIKMMELYNSNGEFFTEELMSIFSRITPSQSTIESSFKVINLRQNIIKENETKNYNRSLLNHHQKNIAKKKFDTNTLSTQMETNFQGYQNYDIKNYNDTESLTFKTVAEYEYDQSNKTNLECKRTDFPIFQGNICYLKIFLNMIREQISKVNSAYNDCKSQYCKYIKPIDIEQIISSNQNIFIGQIKIGKTIQREETTSLGNYLNSESVHANEDKKIELLQIEKFLKLEEIIQTKRNYMLRDSIKILIRFRKMINFSLSLFNLNNKILLKNMEIRKSHEYLKDGINSMKFNQRLSNFKNKVRNRILNICIHSLKSRVQRTKYSINLKCLSRAFISLNINLKNRILKKKMKIIFLERIFLKRLEIDFIEIKYHFMIYRELNNNKLSINSQEDNDYLGIRLKSKPFSKVNTTQKQIHKRKMNHQSKIVDIVHLNTEIEREKRETLQKIKEDMRILKKSTKIGVKKIERSKIQRNQNPKR